MKKIKENNNPVSNKPQTMELYTAGEDSVESFAELIGK